MLTLDSAALVGMMRPVYNDSRDAFRPAPVDWAPIQSPEATAIAAKGLRTMAQAVKSAKPLGPVLKKQSAATVAVMQPRAAVLVDDRPDPNPGLETADISVAPKKKAAVLAKKQIPRPAERRTAKPAPVLGKKAKAVPPPVAAPQRPAKKAPALTKKGKAPVADPVITLTDPAVTGDLKRVYAQHVTQHPTPHGKAAFKKTLHSLHKAGHGVKAAVRVAHLAAKRAEAKGTKPSPKAKPLSFKKRGH